MSGHLEVLALSAVAVLVVMVATWIVSLILRNASIVDIVWGAGFVVVAWTASLVGDGHRGRSNLLVLLVTVWGLRLAGYLLWRNAGKGEDFRYQAMRRRAGDSFPVRSLVTVFGFQGLIMWVVSSPAQLAMTPTGPDLGALTIVGVALWVIGFLFETVGDAQLALFKADPANAGAVMDRGLWRYTRHPNYFGDFCVWWGIFLVAAESGDAWFAIAGPIVMTVLLTRVSGVPMLERSLVRRRPGYADYVSRTSSFIPRPPRPPAHHDTDVR